HPDIELVIDAWFARVSGPNDKVDVTELVRPGRATNETGVGVTSDVQHVRRDAGPVDVQACAVVCVLQMPPGRRTVLTAARDAEVRVGTIVDDEAATGQEVALRLFRRLLRPSAGLIGGEERYCAYHECSSQTNDEYCCPCPQAHGDTSLCPSSRPPLEAGRKRKRWEE